MGGGTNGDGATTDAKRPSHFSRRDEPRPATGRRASKLEPMARHDTNEDKAAAGMTKKTAKWFELSGRPQIRRHQVEGREWISALSCGTQRKSAAVEFQSLCLTTPAPDVEPEDPDDALGRSQARASSARRTEERRWVAGHRSRLLGSRAQRQGASRYGETWYRPKLASASVETVAAASQAQADKACILREKALWIPLAELRATAGKKPGPGRCAALLFRSAQHAIEDERPEEEAASQQHQSTGMAKALGLWQAFSTTA